MRDGGPVALVAEVAALEHMVRMPVYGPGDGLGLPVARGAIDDDGPVMEVIVWNDGRLRQTGRLIAKPPRDITAVHGAVGLHVAVDLLEDVDLAARRPRGAMAHRIAQHPKRRPDALLVRAVAHAEPALHAHGLAGLGRERVGRLDAARRPLARGRLPRHELQRVAARELHVGRVLGVLLLLVVGAVAHGDLPRRRVRRAALAAAKVLGPCDAEVLEGWGVDGGGEADKGRG